VVLLYGWTFIVLTLFPFARTGGFIDHVRDVHIIVWMIAATFAFLFGKHTFSFIVEKFARRRQIRSVIIIGVNEITLRVADALAQGLHADLCMHGYFDDRHGARRPWKLEHPVLGTLDDVSAYVREKNIQLVYIGAPVSGYARIAKLSSELHDTTASIYFVPDMAVFQFTTPRLTQVGNVPVLAVCETPFTGMNRALKRASDVVLGTLILFLLAPVMLAVAAGIRMTSPGPVIFRQRRYGLYGETIVIYKFRSMTVSEDGTVIVQARHDDARVTAIGAFLRRSSLDELPQFFNVLQGSMSIVGPRPYAVAHNEHYRKLIKGYMLRHKIKPGITGWAQVNGLRGETTTIDKMAARVEYDLDYIRKWSVWFDLLIIAKTVGVVFKRQNTY